MKRETTWTIKNKKADFAAICKEQGVGEVTARLLVNRGLATREARTEYLHPSASALSDPQRLKNAKQAAGLLAEDISCGRRIRIIGDYDVDGIVSVYLLYRTLSRLGAEVDYRIPDRVKDGYGINEAMVEEAAAAGVQTILTCDNGIAAVEPVALAKAKGLRVILTDHHDIPTREENETTVYVLPEADVIVNPKQEGETTPYPGICGAVVAYKVMLCLAGEAGKERLPEDFLRQFLPYVALATVCDVMELTGENRALVALGLKELRHCREFGLAALIEENHLQRDALGAYHLGFVLGPCLNASGRLDTALKGLSLLLSKTPQEAAALAREVTELNARRKDMTARGVELARKQLEREEALPRVLVIYLPECHESLAGIIAGRIREYYYRPTIVLTDAEDGGLKGSGRSIEGYSMFEALLDCKELLEKFGGHPMAAGMSLPKENLEAFRRRLNERCTLTQAQLVEKISIDIVLPFGLVTEQVIRELGTLEPFGRGNEKPVFAERALSVQRAAVLGKNGTVLKLWVENAYGRRFEALYFGETGEFEETVTAAFGEEQVRRMFQGRENNVRLSVLYYPRENEFRGEVTLQAVLLDYRAEPAERAGQAGAFR